MAVLGRASDELMGQKANGKEVGDWSERVKLLPMNYRKLLPSRVITYPCYLGSLFVAARESLMT